MQNLFLFAVIALAVTTFGETSFSKTNCYCEIGAYPPQQQKFFKTGCELWLQKQKNCDVKKMIPQSYDYRADLSQSIPDQLNLKIGYVGHWSNSSETINYLSQVIVPLIAEFKVSVDIDNTACKALDQPYRVKDYIQAQRLPAGSYLSFKGNQVNSVGMWDKILGPSLNLNAVVSTVYKDVGFPRCLIFEGRSCLQNIQANDSGLCIDDFKKLKQLTCCQQLIDIGVGDAPNFQQKYIWSERCN